MEGPPPNQLIACAQKGVSAEKLAATLLEALFTDQELVTGNCSQPRRESIQLLDAHRVQGIRGANGRLNLVLFSIFPITTSFLWREIKKGGDGRLLVQKSLNAKCRSKRLMNTIAID